ncbi:hypothetical protein [Streptococcus thoraltensis]|uniref:hypothetical protein n=1 Tax=Streptococcus thoraltensis TaxID=55085 RepID=UPI001F59D928|nr:hypothetical protein [Streptococcus thoraltensis]
MYFGHYAVATAVKAKEPEMPVLPIFLATGMIDIRVSFKQSLAFNDCFSYLTVSYRLY